MIFDLGNSREPYNATVECYFIDKEYYFYHKEVVSDSMDYDHNDLGQENPSFNFTIHFKD